VAILLAGFSALLISSCLSSAVRAFSAAATFVLYSSKINASSAEYVGAFWLREVPEIEKQGQFRHVCGPTSNPTGRLSRCQASVSSRCQDLFFVSELAAAPGQCILSPLRETV
jgi:hypothetical protein